MAKYNLMDTEKPDYFDRYFDEEDDKKESPKTDSGKLDSSTLQEIDDREYFDESLFTEDTSEQPVTEQPAPKDDFADIQMDKPEPFTAEEEIKPEPETIKPFTEEPEAPPPPPPPPPKPKPQTTSTITDYEYDDSKLQGINWKPLVIWGSIIVVIIVLGYFGYNYFLAGGTDEVVEEKPPALSPQEQLRLEQEKKKIAFIKNIAQEKTARLNNFSTLTDLKTSKIAYSSVLLYGESFTFEIFGSSRDDIAKYNQNIKNRKFDEKYKIVTVSTRPGSNGGVFALYKVNNPNAAANASVADPSIDTNIQATIDNLINKNSLKIKNDRIVTRQNVDQFELIRKEIMSTGSESNCIQLLKDLKSLNTNFNVHKISLIPTNQKSIKNSKYNLLIVFDYYV